MDLKSTLSGLKDKVDDLLEKTDIDEKIVEKAGALKDKAGEFLEKTNIDEKVVEKAGELKDKAGELLEKTDLDEKIAEKAGALKDKVAGLFGKAEEAAEDLKAKAEDAACERGTECVLPAEAVGRVSADFFYCYPPGIPLLVPGERIDEGFVRRLEAETDTVRGLREGKVRVIHG